MSTVSAKQVLLEILLLKKNLDFKIPRVQTKAFTEESDHLWKKHCQRDFKNESLLEYECWREMYLRLFNEREEKLKTLTRNILSAQSEKPKGNICEQLFKFSKLSLFCSS